MRAAFLTLLLAAAATAQIREPGATLSTPFVVTGTVAAGGGMEIVLLDEAGSPVAETVAGAGGQFRITVRDPGHYRLALRQGPRYLILEPVLLTSGEPVATVHAAAQSPFEIRQRPPGPADANPLVDAARLAKPIPQKARKLFQQALDRTNRGDDEGAAERLEKAVALAPHYLEALNDLAVAYMRRRDYGRAEAALRRAIELAPSAWRPRLNLGVLFLDQESYSDARAEMERAQKLGPNSPLPAFHLGRLHLIEGRGEQAEACFSRALEIESDLPVARLFRGYARMLTGRLAEARDDLAAYLQQAPDAANAADVRRRLAELDRIQ